MPRVKRSIHYIYKTTNLLNGRYYIGKHSAFILEDGYLGSGKRLRYEIDKYGRENFKKEILEFCNSRESVADRERQIVNEELLKDPLCINLKIGGEGGGPPGGFWNEEHKEKFRRAAHSGFLGKHHTEKTKKIISLASSKRSGKNSSFYNKHHTEETKRKLSIAKSRMIGELSSVYKTKWITNGIDDKRINVELFVIPEGWKLGRSCKPWNKKVL